MKSWWNRKKGKTRKRRKGKGDYTIVDFFVDVLYWIPEVLFLPFRMLFWLFRGLGRFVKELVDLV